MLISALIPLLVAASPVALALPGMNGVGLTEGEAQLYSERLAQKLTELGLKVMTARDVAALMGLERQKQLMGCDDGSCVAELAGALGADGIVMGDVGKLDQTYAVNLKVLAKEGATLAIFNGEARSAAEVPDVLAAGARALAHQLALALHRPELEPAVVTSSAPRSVRLVAAAPLALGVLALIGFGVSEGVASAKLTAIGSAATLGDAALYRDQGKSWQTAGNVLVALGATLVVIAAVMFIWGALS